MTREITHMKAFMAALDSMGKTRFSIGRIPPTPGLVDQFFNDSTGEGDDGEVDAQVRGILVATGSVSKRPHWPTREIGTAEWRGRRRPIDDHRR